MRDILDKLRKMEEAAVNCKDQKRQYDLKAHELQLLQVSQFLFVMIVMMMMMTNTLTTTDEIGAELTRPTVGEMQRNRRRID